LNLAGIKIVGYSFRFKRIPHGKEMKVKHNEMNKRFSGKVALVAGGTGGLGRAVSMAFLEEGAQVVVTYRDQREWDDLKGLRGTDISALAGHRVDVTDAAGVVQFVQGLVAEYGHLDVVVNTVGAYAGGVKLWEMDPKVFDQMLTLNLRSGYAILRAVVPAMLKQKGGAIINVSSKAAFDHAGGAAAYAASKAAAVAMIDSLAADLKGTGVHVNSILPSIIDTEANRRAMPKAAFAQWPKPEEIARVILFLCSDDAQLIHGAAVPVYGDS
jgi:NAD(P)-dependent dehydrogenase (short-subunit alcohol dehydrogenase family)